MMNLTPRGKTFAALFTAALAAAAAWLWLLSRERELLRMGRPVKVVVARRHIESFTRLQAKHLAVREYPAAYVPKGAVTAGGEALGLLSLAPFNEGELLLHNKLSSGSQTLASAVPEGMRAFAIPVDKVTGLNGLLRPGDLVDVLFLSENSSNPSVLFQSAKVIAAGTLIGDKEDKEATGGSVTLALSPGDCLRALSAMAAGVLHFSLRATGDIRYAGGEDFTPTKRWDP